MRPRATLGAALALAGTAVAMPGAVAFPLALLLTGVRPVTERTRVAVIASLLLMAGWMAYVGAEDPLNLLTHVATIVGGGLFALLMRSGPRPALEASLLATGAALAVGVTGISAFGIDLASTRADLVYSTFLGRPEVAGAFRLSGLPDALPMALHDGTLILALVAGHCVAWRWYQILAAPEGLPAPTRFVEFRFSDHLIWLFVLGLLGVVAQIGGELDRATAWPGALLATMTILYSIRGLAVLWPKQPDFPTPVLLLLGVAVLFLLRFALPGLLGLGLADTWLDFRRRAAAASGE